MPATMSPFGIPPKKLKECLHQTFPPVMPELLREAASPEPDFDNIARIISLDPALTATILTLVNSAYYGLNQKVTDLKRASVVLGNREIFKLAFSVTLVDNLGRKLGDTNNAFFANWRLVLWSAVASELIAERLAPDHTEIAYLCALLKDISLLLAVSLSPKLSKNTSTPLLNGPHPHEKERTGHGRLTTELLKEWSFPKDFFTPIELHHDISHLDTHPPLVQAVILGTRWAEIELNHNVLPGPLLQFRLSLTRLLGLNEDDIVQLRQRVIQRFRSLTNSLGINEAPPEKRLYEHTLQSIQLYYFQSMEITQAEGGLAAVAAIIFKHLAWNWKLTGCELSLRIPDTGNWLLFRCDKGRASPFAEHVERTSLPWRNKHYGHPLHVSGRTLGELRFSPKIPKADISEITLYLWFAGQSFEHYSLRHSVLETKAQALDILPVGVASCDANGVVLEGNAKLKQFFGIRGSIKGTVFHQALSNAKGISLSRDWEQFLKNKTAESFSKILCPLGPEGTKHPVCLYIAAYASKVGHSRRILVMVEDVTEVTDLQVKALQQRAFLASLVQAMQEVVMVVDGGGTIQFASPRLAEWLEGKNLFVVFHPTELYTGRWDPSILREAAGHIEVDLVLEEEDRPLPLEIVITALEEKQRSYLVVGRDLTAIHRLENKLKRQAIYDHLTGVFNRHQFQIFLEREVARSARREEPLGLMFFDIDRFKELNDRKGHHEGDRCLQSLGQILKSSLRRGMDYPCRYGGDEFTVLATNVTRDRMEQLARRIRAECHTRLGGEVSLSVGLAIFGQDEHVDTFLKRADQASLEAKRAGGDRYVWSE